MSDIEKQKLWLAVIKQAFIDLKAGPPESEGADYFLSGKSGKLRSICDFFGWNSDQMTQAYSCGMLEKVILLKEQEFEEQNDR